MKLRNICIKNFRNIINVSIPIDDATIFVGENNVGKTAFLDAIKLAISKSIPRRGKVLDVYDYHMSRTEDTPETSEGIVIDLWFREDESEEWPDSIVQELQGVVILDPINNINSIGLRFSSKYDSNMRDIVTSRDFLNADGEILVGSSKHYHKFSTFIRIFYLSALRNPNNEFSSQSQYWGKMLKELEISEDQSAMFKEQLTLLNEQLLSADPRLEQMKGSLNQIQELLCLNDQHTTSIQALPIKPWELLLKSELVIKGLGSEVFFPLLNHGQGVQSLAILFLFQAYIDVFLKPTYNRETEAILALEEPEAHLHPQAIRALASNIGRIDSQKLITTHSPYFIQEIPFKNIRLLRRDGTGVKVLYIKRSYTANLPNIPQLKAFCAQNSNKFAYNAINSQLVLKGKLEEAEYRRLMGLTNNESNAVNELSKLKTNSSYYLSDNDLEALETHAKRVRGEILFARAWLLCEGQCEYLLYKYFSDLLGLSLDQAGVSIIDFQNSGSPGIFACLAKTFEIPWLMVCDNDSARDGFINELSNRGISSSEITSYVRYFPDQGDDLELYLVKNGFSDDLLEIITESGINLTKNEGEEGYEDEIAEFLRGDKVKNTISLIRKLKTTQANSSRVPGFFSEAITDIVNRAV